MTDKLDAYSDVISRLVGETVSCCPTDWNQGVLDIQSDGERLTYQLKNEGHPERAAISEDLRDLIDEFYVRMASAGDVWTDARISWTRTSDNVKFNVAFEYPEAVSAPEFSVSAAKKPWWKFGLT